MEKVMCVKKEVVEEYQGFCNREGIKDHCNQEMLIGVLEYKKEFIDKDKVENDFNYKQIIPCVIVINNHGDILLTYRNKAQSEKRLIDCYSICIGGHINEQDLYNGKCIENGIGS